MDAIKEIGLEWWILYGSIFSAAFLAAWFVSHVVAHALLRIETILIVLGDGIERNTDRILEKNII